MGILGIYRFCLKTHGSARLDSRPTLSRGQAFCGSFGLPGANQIRGRAAGHYKPENSNQMGIFWLILLRFCQIESF